MTTHPYDPGSLFASHPDRHRDADWQTGELHRLNDWSGPLLEVVDLRVEFRTRLGVVRALNGVSYQVSPGETLAILGESGSGKSVSAQAVMGLLESPPAVVTGGQVRYRNEDLLKASSEHRRRVRGKEISIIFQDALSALNPVFTVGWQIAETLRVRRGLSKTDALRRAVELMDLVRIPAAKQRLHDFPHQFSGGMRQRAMIAMALALDPAVLIADEPTTALDVTVQAQIMGLLAELRREFNMALILITHDLGVVADVADRIAVMYAGRVIENADVHSLYAAPAHPYTKGLLESVPRLDQRHHTLRSIKGMPPSLTDIPAGCPFHPRCPYAQPVCCSELPDEQLLPGARSGGRTSACHFAHDLLRAGPR
ncbi:MAG: ABC transporter ATP-binding protein [Micromonosporaceae bacterium]